MKSTRLWHAYNNAKITPSELQLWKLGYRIPTAREMPEVVTLMVEKVDPSAILGAKGAAECATVAVAPAIINAIANATGRRVHHLPARPDRVLALMK